MVNLRQNWKTGLFKDLRSTFTCKFKKPWIETSDTPLTAPYYCVWSSVPLQRISLKILKDKRYI